MRDVMRFIYCAFAAASCLIFLLLPLLKLGENGLLPATRYMERLEGHLTNQTTFEKVLKVRITPLSILYS